MAVIINDFEIAVEPSATEAANPEQGGNATETEATPKMLTPHDVDTLLKRVMLREMRKLAH